MELPSTSFIPASQATPAAASNKSDTAYRTISEAAEQLNVPQHVLRFWETKFSQIRPMKRSGGRRYYRPQDLATLALIQNLLYDQGYTIKGVQRLLKQRRNGDELADMDQAALVQADRQQAAEPMLDLDALVDEVSATAAALESQAEPVHTSGLLSAMADVLADMPPSVAGAIPAHLPARPAALMAAGIEAGRPYPPAVHLLNPVSEGQPASGLAIEQRLRLESLLEELLALKAEFS